MAIVCVCECGRVRVRARLYDASPLHPSGLGYMTHAPSPTTTATTATLLYLLLLLHARPLVIIRVGARVRPA